MANLKVSVISELDKDLLQHVVFVCLSNHDGDAALLSDLFRVGSHFAKHLSQLELPVVILGNQVLLFASMQLGKHIAPLFKHVLSQSCSADPCLRLLWGLLVNT